MTNDELTKIRGNIERKSFVIVDSLLRAVTLR